MKTRKLFSAYLLTLFLISSSAIAQPSEYRIIEIVTLNEGFTEDYRENYMSLINPYLDKYGFEELTNLQVIKKARGTGPDNAQAINVWKIPGPDALEKIMNDPGYQQHVMYRNLIFNMETQTMFLAKASKEGELTQGKMVLTDFVVMQGENGEAERTKYFKKLEKITSKYEMKRTAVYEIDKLIAGKGPNAAILNLWEVSSGDVLKKVIEDEEYKTKMVPVRDQTFDMEEITIYMTSLK